MPTAPALPISACWEPPAIPIPSRRSRPSTPCILIGSIRPVPTRSVWYLDYTGAYHNWSANSVTPVSHDANGNPNGGGDHVASQTLVDLHLSYNFPDGDVFPATRSTSMQETCSTRCRPTSTARPAILQCVKSDRPVNERRFPGEDVAAQTAAARPPAKFRFAAVADARPGG